MAYEARGLHLSFEGLPATVIRSQVVALLAWLRAREMLSFDMLSFACSKRLYEESALRLSDVRDALPNADVVLRRGLRPALPGALAWYRRALAAHLDRYPGRYRLIHARTDYAAAAAAPVARDRGIELVWDCRGDAAAEFRLRTADSVIPAFVRSWRERLLLRDVDAAAKGSTRAIFVTPQLKAMWHTALEGKPAYVIPCLGDERVFNFDPVLRAETRGRLDYKPEAPVFVYSGTLSRYQGFDLAVAFFERALLRSPSARLLILTPASIAAASGLGNVPPHAWKIINARYEEMNAYLNAADFAFLLRPPDAVNHSAFPTKFAEFGLTGLSVVMNASTPACLDYAHDLGNLVTFDAQRLPVPATDEARSLISARYSSRLTFSSFVDTYAKVYACALPA